MSVYNNIKNWCKANCDKEVKHSYKDIVKILQVNDPELADNWKFKNCSAFHADDTKQTIFVYKSVKTECVIAFIDCKKLGNSICVSCDIDGWKPEERDFPCEFYEDTWSMSDDFKSLYEVFCTFNNGYMYVDDNLVLPVKLVGSKKDLQTNETKFFRLFCNHVDEQKSIISRVRGYSSVDDYFDDDSDDSFNRNEAIDIIAKETGEIVMTIMKFREGNENLYKAKMLTDSNYKVIKIKNKEFDSMMFDFQMKYGEDLDYIDVAHDLWNASTYWDNVSLLH